MCGFTAFRRWSRSTANSASDNSNDTFNYGVCECKQTLVLETFEMLKQKLAVDVPGGFLLPNVSSFLSMLATDSRALF